MSEKNNPNQKPRESGTGTNPPAAQPNQPGQPKQGDDTRREVQPPAQQSDEQKKNQQPREEERKKQDREKTNERRP